jgi:hypothetical protein
MMWRKQCKVLGVICDIKILKGYWHEIVCQLWPLMDSRGAQYYGSILTKKLFLIRIPLEYIHFYVKVAKKFVEVTIGLRKGT